MNLSKKGSLNQIIHVKDDVNDRNTWNIRFVFFFEIRIFNFKQNGRPIF